MSYLTSICTQQDLSLWLFTFKASACIVGWRCSPDHKWVLLVYNLISAFITLRLACLCFLPDIDRFSIAKGDSNRHCAVILARAGSKKSNWKQNKTSSTFVRVWGISVFTAGHILAWTTSACGVNWPSDFSSGCGFWQAQSCKSHRRSLQRAPWQAAPRSPPHRQYFKTWTDTLNGITTKQVERRPSLYGDICTRWVLDNREPWGGFLGVDGVFGVCGGERCCSHKCHVSDGLWCRMRVAFVSLSAISVSDPSYSNSQVVRCVPDEGFANDRCRHAWFYNLLTAKDSCQVQPGSHVASPIFFQSSFTCHRSSACSPLLFFCIYNESNNVTFCVDCATHWHEQIQPADNLLSNLLSNWAQWAISAEEHWRKSQAKQEQRERKNLVVFSCWLYGGFESTNKRQSMILFFLIVMFRSIAFIHFILFS